MSDIAIALKDPTSGQTTRRLDTRRRLLEAGTVLFAAGGVRDVTSTAIANLAGVATGTFYLHFPDKHALFEALVESTLEEIGAHFNPGDPGEAGARSEEGIRRSLEGLIDVVERRRSLIRAVFDRGEGSSLAERIQDRIASQLEGVYTELFRERRISVHPGAAAQARAALTVRVIAWWAEDPSRASRDEIIDTLFTFDPRRVGGK